MNYVEILLRITHADNKVISVSSSIDADSVKHIPEIQGSRLSDIFPVLPDIQKYSLVKFVPDSSEITAAAKREDDETIVVYYILSQDAEQWNPAIPYAKIEPVHAVPVVSPGLVTLLGYTPWELAQSTIFSELLASDIAGSGTITLLDKSGNGHRLVYSRQNNLRKGVDFIFLPQPDELAFPVSELQLLTSLNVESPQDILNYLAEALGLDSALLFCRFMDGYLLTAQHNMNIDSEHFETSDIFNPDKLQHPFWIDVDADENFALGDTGHCLVYPADLIVLFAPWRGNADILQQKADMLMPAVSIKYRLFSLLNDDLKVELLLEKLESMVFLDDVLSIPSLRSVLETASRGFRASVLAVFGTEETAVPIATSKINNETRELLLSDKPFDECFSDVHITLLSNGFTLLTAWDDKRTVSYDTVDSFGAMLRKKDLLNSVFCTDVQPDFSSLKAVFMKNTDVLWHGATLDIKKCYHFYNRVEQCPECPLNQLKKTHTKSAILENNNGYIEEIHPTEHGFLVTWTHVPGDYDNPADNVDIPTADFPGGTAVYRNTGEILRWDSWFSNSVGVSLEQAKGQSASRLLDKLGIKPLLDQLHDAMNGSFIREPVEFLHQGILCYSKMSYTDNDIILHTIFDSNTAGIATDISAIGPGVLLTPNIDEPSCLAESLSLACEKSGWDFDVSGITTSSGFPVWFRKDATLDILQHMLHLLSPVCLERWTGLETAFLKDTPKGSNFYILSGNWHVLRFRIHSKELPDRVAILSNINLFMRGFGGWLAGSPEKDVIQIGFPVAQLHTRAVDLIVYSPPGNFLNMCRNILSDNMTRQAIFTDSIEELSAGQVTANSLILRLDHTNMYAVSTLAARIPNQKILAASGLNYGLPTGAGVQHIRIPTTRDSLVSAIRRIMNND